MNFLADRWCLLWCCVSLQWEDALNHFKSELASGRDVFGPLIHKYLLDNKHRWATTAALSEAVGGLGGVGGKEGEERWGAVWQLDQSTNVTCVAMRFTEEVMPAGHQRSLISNKLFGLCP
jgi:hypothetical protein